MFCVLRSANIDLRCRRASRRARAFISVSDKNRGLQIVAIRYCHRRTARTQRTTRPTPGKTRRREDGPSSGQHELICAATATPRRRNHQTTSSSIVISTSVRANAARIRTSATCIYNEFDTLIEHTNEQRPQHGQQTASVYVFSEKRVICR